MKKFLLVTLIFTLPFFSSGQADEPYLVKGRVIASADGEALVGASVIIKGTTTGSVTDNNGQFVLEVPEKETILTISFIGFVSRDITLSPPVAESLIVSLEEDIFALGEVEVVSTGYQKFPKERATGSFVQIGNDLIDRSVSTGILQRLGGITPGLLLNPEGGLEGGDPVSIRGYSTIFADPDPLIVVDNFPYDGDIENINPNDVENITVLKDAAAASIWGARAGNGVIVITTKQGKFGQGQGPLVSFNSNLTVENKPDAYYVPRMSVSDYIATEKALFSDGYFSYDETAYDHRAISPLVELLIAERNGELTPEEATERIAELGRHDVRDDFEKYLYRESISQQYAVSISGGDQQQHYFLSAGYDHNLGQLVGNSFQRITLNAKNNWSFFDKKLWLSGNLYYSQSYDKHNGIDPSGIRMSDYNLLPSYTRLAGEEGQALSVIQDYRASFVETAEANGFLNWEYRPLEELGLNDQTTRLTDYRVNFGAGYRIIPGLEATMRYQYWQSLFSGRDYYPEESYYARDLVNSFTQTENDGALVRPVPIGGILDRRGMRSFSHNFRAQLGYARKWKGKHEVNAIAGYEIKGEVTKGNTNRYYGYDGDFPISSPVDYTTNYSISHNPYRSMRIPASEGHTYLTDRFISYYANASYTYRHRYTLSASARRDQSNLFGVEANQRGVPLWSAGLGWTVSNEGFYHWEWMPFLKIRATYGYNGNIDKSVTAYTTAQVIGNSYSTGLLYGQVTNPANPDLRWERVAMQNIGIDFASKNDRVKGTIEFYGKQGYDLVGFAPLPPSVGQEEFRGNTAETKGHGIDFSLSTLNIDHGLRWRTDWLFSRADIRVSDYLREENRTYFLLDQGHFGGSPQEGKPLHVLYSYDWAGLDPQTGNPSGYLNGEVSQEYGDIIDRATVDSLVYHGSARPTIFGAIRNTFSWKNLSLSVNISYRMGYYFRRKSIDYYYDQGLGGHGDYALRWKKPGDEAFTDVPSIPESPNSNRDTFYEYSEVLVERGDHIRLQDINLTYTLDRKNNPSFPFRSIQIYGYVRHLGILWKATDKVTDPDFRRNSAPTSYSLGLRANF